MSAPSRHHILNKLRAVQSPFMDAEPRPKTYLRVTSAEGLTPENLIERFQTELINLRAEPFQVADEHGAREKIVSLLQEHQAKRVLAWDFQHISVEGLETAIRAENIEIVFPDLKTDDRPEVMTHAEGAEVGLTGVDAAAATTGTLIFSSGIGKGRTPTILSPLHIVVIRREQILPQIEDWVAQKREAGLAQFVESAANFCFISGPSRTGDIEMEMVFGAHGPARLQVIIIG